MSSQALAQPFLSAVCISLVRAPGMQLVLCLGDEELQSNSDV